MCGGVGGGKVTSAAAVMVPRGISQTVAPQEPQPLHLSQNMSSALHRVAKLGFRQRRRSRCVACRLLAVVHR